MPDPSRAGSLFQSLRTAQRSDVDPVDVASGGFLHRDQVVEAGDQTDAASAGSSICSAPARSSW
jgi:hypothetical protein